MGTAFRLRPLIFSTIDLTPIISCYFGSSLCSLLVNVALSLPKMADVLQLRLKVRAKLLDGHRKGHLIMKGSFLKAHCHDSDAFHDYHGW